MRGSVLILDAMGVIFTEAHITRALLYPFIKKHGGSDSLVAIKHYYRDASLGKINARQFWQAVGLSPSLESEYLSLYQLAPGLPTFMNQLPTTVSSCWCLSNDVSTWSSRLREMHHLQNWFDGFIISADIGLRKPDPVIYHQLLSRITSPANQCILVDDKPQNLDAAARLGMRTILFGLAEDQGPRTHIRAQSFAALAKLL